MTYDIGDLFTFESAEQYLVPLRILVLRDGRRILTVKERMGIGGRIHLRINL